MIDPLTSLAFSVYSGEGVYALLLGSGLSRAAQIPTGWEGLLDLIRNIAAVEGQAAIQKEVGQGPDLRRSCTG